MVFCSAKLPLSFLTSHLQSKFFLPVILLPMMTICFLPCSLPLYFISLSSLSSRAGSPGIRITNALTLPWPPLCLWWAFSSSQRSSSTQIFSSRETWSPESQFSDFLLRTGLHSSLPLTFPSRLETKLKWVKPAFSQVGSASRELERIICPSSLWAAATVAQPEGTCQSSHGRGRWLQGPSQ
jgi:hypothetical protein